MPTTQKSISKPASLAIVTGIYVLAAAVGAAAYLLLPFPWWLNLLLADVLATVVTFIFSCALRNASVYDPYWSVQPLVILAGLALVRGSGGAGIYALLMVTAWSLRLTGNWVYTFHGLTKYEDWRYIMLREKTGVFYPAVNFLGIHLVPTLIVYACTLPGAVLIREGLALNWGSAVLLTLCLVSIWLELSSDVKMHRFKARGGSGFIREGLWKFARHPNYLGEITFWWFQGLALVCLMPEKWYLLAGALLNTVLFFAASIPMAEKHQARKPGFDAYKRETRLLLPIKK